MYIHYNLAIAMYYVNVSSYCDFFGFYSGYFSGLSGGFVCYEIHPEIIEKGL